MVQGVVPLRTAALCANSHAVGAHLPRPPGLLNVAVAARALHLDRHHEDLGVLEDGGRADVAKGSVSSEVDVVVGREAAAHASEGAGAQLVRTGLEAGGGGSGHELAGEQTKRSRWSGRRT